MMFSFSLLLLCPAAWAGPSVDANVPMWTRAEYNAAIMTRLAGLPTDARQDQLLKRIGKDSKTGEARPVEPMQDPAEREKLKAALGGDLAFLKEALEHRRNVDMSNADLDIQMVQRFNEKHNGLINEFWPKSGAGSAGVPPPTTVNSLPPVPPPVKTPGDSPGADPGFAPGSGPAGSPGGFDPGTPGKGSPGDAAAPNGDVNNKGGSDLGKLRGNFSKALGDAKDGAGSFNKKEDDLNAAPKPAGPQGQPGSQGPPQRPNQPGPEHFSPGNAPGQVSYQGIGPGRPDSFSPRGSASPSFPPGTAAPVSRSAGPGSSPGVSAPEAARAPGGSFGAGPSMASPGAGGPPASSLDPKLLDKKAPPGEESLSPEELAAIKDIQKMLGAASGETPLDTEALKNGAGKLDSAAAGAVWKGVDVNALRDQIGKVLEMAGVEGLSLTQQQVVYQAAANLGLSDQQAGRIIKALRISEPPSPHLEGLTWWQRLLAWLRYYKKQLLRRLV